MNFLMYSSWYSFSTSTMVSNMLDNEKSERVNKKNMRGIVQNLI